MLTDNFTSDDRRRMVGAGVRRGRDAEVADLRAIADLGLTNVTSTIIATRGERLILGHARFSGPGDRPETAVTEILGVIEIDADQRITTTVAFDPDDMDAAFDELEARYLAGEAAPYARTWLVITRGYAALNRQELPATTPDWVDIDRRRLVSIEAGGMKAYLRDTWDVTSQVRIHVKAVHRLNNLGAVVTHSSSATSQEGLDAEWQDVNLLTVDGDVISRCELFDETDIAAALARFDELSPAISRPENAASRSYERVKACFAARDWDALAEMLAINIATEDRRRVVNAGVRQGRDAALADVRAYTEVGAKAIALDFIATRGDHLVLTRGRPLGRDGGPEAFSSDVLDVIETAADGRIVARILFDSDDFDAAIAELDARYLANEAAPCAGTWSAIVRALVAVNRREVPATTSDLVDVDHRRTVAIAPGGVLEYMRENFSAYQWFNMYVEIVHRLDDLGAVVTWASHATSHDGFDAEWRGVHLLTVEGDSVSRAEMFDEQDLDAAIARFAESHSSTKTLENAATRAYETQKACFADRDWEALADIINENACYDDRRRVVNSGTRHGRDAMLREISGIAEVGAKQIASEVIATRGDSLALSRAQALGQDPRPEAFRTHVLDVVETDADGRMVARILFDPDDFDAAIAELDARYLVGEAAPYVHTWSAIRAGYAAVNQRRPFSTTPDWVNIDHRRGIAFAPGEMLENMRAQWDLASHISLYVEAVHRLNDRGAVVTRAAHGTSRQGFDAEWRVIDLLTFEGDMVSRCETFDESDLDAARARFEELSTPITRLENAASQVVRSYQAHFAARDWDAMERLVADDMSTEDRRRVVNGGVMRGREVEIANIRTIADLGGERLTSRVIATRGNRLVLARTTFSSRDWPDSFEIVDIVEINTDHRLSAHVLFDPNDIEAAFAELDARYVAGEAAAHAHTWSVITQVYAGLNRHELSATTPDWVNLDHRRVAGIESGDLTSYIRAVFDDTPDISVHIEAVHRLSNRGALYTLVGRGTSHQGFDAEWRGVDILMVEGDRISHCERFDEADLDAAIARFEELHSETRRLQNTASRMYECLTQCFAERDWAAIADMLADDVCSDDRRRVVNAGIRRGRDTNIADMRAVADVGVTDIPGTPIATRGERLALLRSRLSGRDTRPGAYHNEVLHVVEVNADDRIAAVVVFDGDDVDAAFVELDARYLAGEAAPNAHTWSVIAGAHAAFNRHEPPTADYVNIDHRRGSPFTSDNVTEFIRGVWEVTPDLTIYIEAVHHLRSFGALFTNCSRGISRDGFDAEWRMIQLVTVEGDRISRCEIFDEADIDIALARFHELQSQTRRLENAASRIYERYRTCFAARDWAAITEIMAANTSYTDRRHVVNVGFRQGRDTVIRDLSAVADVWLRITSDVIAARGERLVLSRTCASGERGREPFHTLSLDVVEIDSDERIVGADVFDVDDIDAAFAELDARYLAGEAAAHARTWSVIMDGFAALNRHELPRTTTEFINADHRRGTGFAPGDLFAYLRATWHLTPNRRHYIEVVHRLSDLGAVCTAAAYGISQEGFDAEWRMILILTVEGDLFSRGEVFEETDLDAALQKFDQLNRPVRNLENAASQVLARIWALLADEDWNAITKSMADDFNSHDHRRVVNAGVRRGRDVHIANLRVVADIGFENLTSTVIATRGNRLALSRVRSSARGLPPGEVSNESLSIVEIDAENRLAAHAVFDVDDIDAAFAELDARYLAGEAAAQSDMWSYVVQAYAVMNRHELPPMSDWVTIDHRVRETFEADDLSAYTRAMWDIAPDLKMYIEAVHRLSDCGAVVTHVAYGNPEVGFEAEWRMVAMLIFGGDRINRCELFDEEDLDAALVRFDELDRPAPLLENAATRVWARAVDAINRRDLDKALADAAPDARYEDRRKGLRDEGPMGPEVVRALFEAASEWLLETEPIAIRGDRLALGRDRYRETVDATRPVALEHLTLLELDDDNRGRTIMLFDPDDINGAMAELTARWIASGKVAHPEVIDSLHSLIEATNRHDWDALATASADATYINHRQLPSAGDTIADHMSSTRMTAELIPDLSVEIPEILAHSASGVVIHSLVKGTSTDGVAVEIPCLMLTLFEGARVTHVELYDVDDRDMALSRFAELRP
ncbi:MAG: hypothetical protein ACM4D3_17645 [Candidatus Sericytochromatia bacterium]